MPTPQKRAPRKTGSGGRRGGAARSGSAPAYAAAGVDVALGNALKSSIHDRVRATHGPRVLGRIGGFGGFFRAAFPGMKDPVLVASIDGVGTKLKLAFEFDAHERVARDLVNHCVNDIAVTGAEPLFFLDYIGSERLDPTVFRALIRGFSAACREAGCALIGGETAQLPDMYRKGEYDLAGCIVGAVDRSRIIDGATIRSGDVVVGLPADGLHTNGYTLARKVLFETMKLRPDQTLPGLRRTLGAELLRGHCSYLPELKRLDAGVVKGAAHITGGGLIDNLPRILPPDCDAVIDGAAWRVPRIFRVIQDGGGIAAGEMYRVFNMGVGMALVVSSRRAASAAERAGGRIIGRIEKGSGVVQLQ